MIGPLRFVVAAPLVDRAKGNMRMRPRADFREERFLWVEGSVAGWCDLGVDR